MPQPFVTNAVVRAIRNLPSFPDLTVLDLSCGEGEVLTELVAAGCRGQGTHYRQDDYIIKDRSRLANIAVKGGVDLKSRLPFADATFDVVVLTEVLEHLESHFNVLREAGRVLRPGGHLVFSTPNIFRLHSRLQFFLSGKHKLIRRRAGWDLPSDKLYAYHINPVDFPLLHTVLYQSGLQLDQLFFTRFKFKSVLFLPFWPLVWLVTRFTVDAGARAPGLFRDGELNLNRWLTHPALLYSEQLLGVARRRAV